MDRVEKIDSMSEYSDDFDMGHMPPIDLYSQKMTARGEQSSLEDQIKELQKILSEKDSKINELEEELEEEKDNNDDINLKLIEMQSSNVEMQKKFLKYKGISKTLQNHLIQSENEKKKLQDEMKIYDTTTKKIRQHLNVFQKQVEVRDKVIADKNKVIANYEKIIEDYEQEEQKQKQKQEINDLYNISVQNKKRNIRMPFKGSQVSKTVYDCANPQCKFGGKIYTNKQSAIQLQSCGHKVHIQCMTVGKPCCQCGIKMK